MVDSNTIDKLALQVAQAFGAAFPESTMVQLQPPEAQTTPVAEASEIPACDHEISAFLHDTLGDSRLCPTCQIQGHIKAIQEVQRQIFRRGGIFESKNLPHGHRALRQRWRKEKLCALSTVTKLEELMDDAQLSASDKAEITSAAETWGKQLRKLVLVPGVRLTVKAAVGEPTEEEHKAARMMIALLEAVVEKEMEEEDREAISLAMRQKEKEHIDQAQRDQSPALEGPCPGRQSATSTPATASTTQAAATPSTPRSILKRKASSSPPTTHQHTRIKFAPSVTISPAHLNTINPSPFTQLPFTQLPTTITHMTQIHRQETMATSKRLQSAFWRPGSDYRPGAWASGAFENKANTSCYKLDWENTEQLARQENEEVEEERAVLKGLKVVTGAWVGLWWVRNVVRYIDLLELEGNMREG
jgi:hypothetical protein